MEANKIQPGQRFLEPVYTGRWITLMLAFILAIVGGIGMALVVEKPGSGGWGTVSGG